MLQQGRLPRRAVVVTFDDGYRDNYEHAWPILCTYGIPATFFVVTGALDRQLRLWWEEVAADVQAIAHHRLLYRESAHQLPPWMVPLLESVVDGSPSQAVAQAIVHRLNTQSRQERQHSLSTLGALADSITSQRPDVMLTWAQLREMQRSGMHIGAHTVTHAFLDELDEDAARQEITTSVRRLRDQLDAPIL